MYNVHPYFSLKNLGKKCALYIDTLLPLNRLPLAPQTGDSACNLGMCPDWESNWQLSVHRPALSPLSHTIQGLATFKLERGPGKR